MCSFSSVHSLPCPAPSISLLSYFGLIQPCSLASAVAWCEIWETYVVFYFKKMISGIECVFLLAVKLWSCPVWFFDDGKEASKCFLSEIHVIKLKVLFISAPSPFTGLGHNVSFSVTRGRSTHCSHYNHFILLANTYIKMATVSILHKSYFKCSSVEDQRSVFSQRGKGERMPLFSLRKPSSLVCPWGECQQWVQCLISWTSLTLAMKGYRSMEGGSRGGWSRNWLRAGARKWAYRTFS